MKTLFCLFSALFIALSLSAQTSIRVACVGNSITYGAGVENRTQNSYPKQLQYLLGEGYNVENFGVSGRTALNGTNLPYTATGEFKRSLEFNPDIVLIKLGTNDTKPQYQAIFSQYKADYKALIESYRKKNPQTRVIIMTPVRCYLKQDEINDSIIRNSIIPTLKQIAYEEHLEIINLYSVFPEKYQQHLMPDMIHPSSIGAGLMAQHIAEVVKYPRASDSQQLSIPIENAKPFNFHGYQGVNFEYKEIPCKIVRPYTKAAKGHPWMIRARFWGHEPQLNQALLERGFTLVYCDVADLYGSPQAVARWDEFYKMMINAGYDKKVVIEAMSRGGLIAFNWAKEHPEKVAAIYGDAPVLDFKSWPLGKGSSEGSKEDANKLLKAYNFQTMDEALAWSKNPIDQTTTLAKHKTPIILVVGDADEVVPIAENATPFEEKIKANKGKIQVIHKPGIGHHPHSLKDPRPILEFILKAKELYENPATQPRPGNEYRSGAGWVKGNDWHSVSQEINRIIDGTNLDLLLLGNSITQAFGGSRTLLTHTPGKEPLNQQLKGLKWEAAGISGDRTENLLWRLGQPEYKNCKPKNVLITIGINNLYPEFSNAQDVAQGVIAVACKAAEIYPNAHIFLLGPLPAGKSANSTIRTKVNEVQAVLRKTKYPKNVFHINPTPLFVAPNGELKTDLYGGDMLHLSTKGYQEWAKWIKSQLLL